MKKAILLAGISGLLASPLALAEISMYGKVHLAIEYEDYEESEESETDLVSNASRLGVEGSTKINDYMEAIFKYEMGLDLDGNTGDDDFWSQRNQYGGLKGSFGKLIAGRHDTPVKKLEGKIDHFGDTYADIGKVLDYYIDSQERENRFLGYYSPKFNNIQFQIATMPGKEEDAEFGDAFSTALVFGDPKMKKTDYFVGLGYDDGVDGEDKKVVRLSGSMKFGDFGLGAIVENADDGDNDHMRYVGSAYYKIGNGKLALQYAAAEELGDVEESDQITVGWHHKLGGGASAYVAYSQRELESVESDHASIGFIYKF